MLKIMEKDYAFHWNMTIQHRLKGDIFWYHSGACDVILRYYATLLDLTIDEARKRMHTRIDDVQS